MVTSYINYKNFIKKSDLASDKLPKLHIQKDFVTCLTNWFLISVYKVTLITKLYIFINN
jgi:hypothetical protein